MKQKFILTTLCLAMLTLLFAGCKKDNDEQSNGNQNVSCAHSYTDGACTKCGEKDPDYKPNGGSGDNENEENPGDGEQTPDDNGPTVPPIDIGGETELPFVPAT